MRFEHFISSFRAWHIFLLALLLAGLCGIVRQIPVYDVFARYAPAAEAFARGDWTYAFHPRFGICFTSMAGLIVLLLRVPGLVACQMVSVLFFALSVFPLYSLFEKVWGKKAAIWGTLCYACSPQLLRYAGEGLRDSTKTFAILLIAWALVWMKEKADWKRIFVLSAGCALLTLIRGEGALVAAFAGLMGIVLLKDWKKSLAGFFLFLLLITPQCYYNYRAIGYFVPELRHGVLLQKAGVPVAGKPRMPLPKEAR